ncbi:MAG: glycosyltransferase family 2 protein [Candidatus Omnitrophota bacterium]|jgi:hypothetical protein
MESQTDKNKTISIIIPFRDRLENVRECFISVLHSEYKFIEVIAVDNASSKETVGELTKEFVNNLRVKIVRSDVNLGAAGGRNLGVRYAQGDLLLFVDSDNVVDIKMVSNLVGFIEKNDDCGMVGPLMLYKNFPDMIWLYFADINMCTSQASYRGTGEKNEKQYAEVIETGHIPNCFLVWKNDFIKLGGFDEKYLIMYEEADLAEKIKKDLKKKIIIYTKAVVYHNLEFLDKKNHCRLFLKSEERAYFISRNRIYFMRKHTSFFNFMRFVFIFLPLLTIYYEGVLCCSGKFKQAYYYLKGSIKGFLL